MFISGCGSAIKDVIYLLSWVPIAADTLMTYVHPDLSACRSGRSRPKYWGGGPYLPSLLFPLEVSLLNTATWSGERCKHPQRGLGRKSNLVHFSVISDIFGGIKFTIFFWESIDHSVSKSTAKFGWPSHDSEGLCSPRPQLGTATGTALCRTDGLLAI